MELDDTNDEEISPQRLLEKPKYKTPITSFLDKSIWNDVYPPAEDTYLLLDAIESDADILLFDKKNKPTFVIEFGTGSGTVLTFVKNIIESNNSNNTFYFAIDINERALIEAAKPVFYYNNHKNIINDTKNAPSNDFIMSNLMSSIIPNNSSNRKEGLMDLIIFNPPYVETPIEEVYHKDIIYRSWAGGPRGRIILDKFLNGLPSIINIKQFCIYLVLAIENDFDEVQTILKEKLNPILFLNKINDSINTKIILRQPPGFENLVILRTWYGINFD